MTDLELNRLVEKYNRYKEHGEVMDYREFILLFDELLRRYVTHNLHSIN